MSFVSFIRALDQRSASEWPTLANILSSLESGSILQQWTRSLTPIQRRALVSHLTLEGAFRSGPFLGEMRVGEVALLFARPNKIFFAECQGQEFHLAEFRRNSQLFDREGLPAFWFYDHKLVKDLSGDLEQERASCVFGGHSQTVLIESCHGTRLWTRP